MGLLAVLASGVHAGSVRKAAEASTVLTGTVDVNPDGSLQGYTVDRSEKVPPGIAAIVDRNIARWTFNLSAPVTLLSEAPDAMPGDGLHAGNAMLRLATPPGGS